MNKMTTMKSAIEKILEAHKQLEPFQKNAFFAVKINNEGYMPLIIERQGKKIIVAHYYQQNGDAVPDPDVKFINLDGKEWLPVAIQHCTGQYIRTGDCEDGVWKFNPREMRDLQSFTKMWARNLLAQGFAGGTIVYAEAGP